MQQHVPKTPFQRFIYMIYPVLAYFGIMQVVSIAFQLIIMTNNLSMEFLEDPYAYIEHMMDLIYQQTDLMYIVIAGLSIILFGIIFKKSEFLYFDKSHQNHISLIDSAATVSISLGFFLAVNIILAILMYLSYTFNEYMLEYTEYMDSLMGGSTVLQILSVGILVPIAEELVFRGLLFNRMRRIATNHTGAILISAFIFGSMHFTGGFVQVAYAFILGCLLAYAYYKYDNILIPIMIHMVFNLSNFLFQINFINNFFSTAVGSLIYYAIAVGCLGFGVMYLFKKKTPKPDIIN